MGSAGDRRAEGAEGCVGAPADLGGALGFAGRVEGAVGDRERLAVLAAAVDELDRGGDLGLVDPGQELDQRCAQVIRQGDQVLVELEEALQALAVLA
jgi:hypothetical protein